MRGGNAAVGTIADACGVAKTGKGEFGFAWLPHYFKCGIVAIALFLSCVFM